MAIFDKTRLIGRTFIESINILFTMGKELETRVEALEAKDENEGDE